MHEAVFKSRMLGGYQKKEVDQYLTTMEEEFERIEKVHASTQQENEKVKAKILQIEEHYRDLWNAYNETEEARKALEQENQQLIRQKQLLKEQIESLEIGNEFLRKQFVRHQIGIPVELEENIRGQLYQEEQACTKENPSQEIVMQPVKVIPKHKQQRSTTGKYVQMLKQFINI